MHIVDIMSTRGWLERDYGIKMNSCGMKWVGMKYILSDATTQLKVCVNDCLHHIEPTP